jgi:hypothetical protein
VRIRWLALLTLVGCGSETRASVPPPAQFGDATVDVGQPPKKDTGVGDTMLSDVVLDVIDVFDTLDGEAPDCIEGKTCVGAPMPTWKAEDFQPKSSGFKKIYGLEAFKGKVTVVALLSGW